MAVTLRVAVVVDGTQGKFPNRAGDFIVVERAGFLDFLADRLHPRVRRLTGVAPTTGLAAALALLPPSDREALATRVATGSETEAAAIADARLLAGTSPRPPATLAHASDLVHEVLFNLPPSERFLVYADSNYDRI